MRFAPAIMVSHEDRRTLQRWSRGRTTPSRLVLRAKIVLLAATRMFNQEIAAELQNDMKTICQWRSRFADLLPSLAPSILVCERTDVTEHRGTECRRACVDVGASSFLESSMP